MYNELFVCICFFNDIVLYTTLYARDILPHTHTHTHTHVLCDFTHAEKGKKKLSGYIFFSFVPKRITYFHGYTCKKKRKKIYTYDKTPYGMDRMYIIANTTVCNNIKIAITFFFFLMLTLQLINTR